MIRIEEGERKHDLDRPVHITITLVRELNWMYHAMSMAVHMEGVDEDSEQQRFYGEAHTKLNAICARYR